MVSRRAALKTRATSASSYPAVVWSALRRNLTWSIFGSVLVALVALLLTMLFTIDFGGPISENQLYSERQDQDGILLVGHAFDVKPTERALKVAWYPVACGKYYNASLTPSASSFWNGYGIAACGLPNLNVTIYVDGETTSPTWDYDPSHIPTREYRQSSAADHSVSDRLNGFVTDTQLSIYTYALHNKKHSVIGLDFMYPFINYAFTHQFLAISNSSSVSVLPILDVILATSTDNYVPTRNGRVTDFTISFDGISEPALVYTAKLSLSLSSVARAFSITLFSVNWGLAIIFVFMTISMVVEKMQNNREIPEGALALPVTIILINPQLRALFIGNPPFGNVLDIFGLLPQMILVGISALVLLIVMSLDIKGGGTNRAVRKPGADLLEEKTRPVSLPRESELESHSLLPSSTSAFRQPNETGVERMHSHGR